MDKYIVCVVGNYESYHIFIEAESTEAAIQAVEKDLPDWENILFVSRMVADFRANPYYIDGMNRGFIGGI